jgi:tRNA A37 methylthiotransferase MiaB
MKVLVLKKGKKKYQYIGRSPFNQSVYFSSKNENLIGSLIDLNITDAFQNSLTGNILSDF